MPIVEERLRVQRVTEETGALRVRIEVHDIEQSVDLSRVEEVAIVERTPVDRVVEERREPWHEGNTLVVPVYAEVEVVQRQLVLVEELRVALRQTEERTTTTVPLKRQRAVVERRTAEGQWIEVRPTTNTTDRTDAKPGSDPSTSTGVLP